MQIVDLTDESAFRRSIRDEIERYRHDDRLQCRHRSLVDYLMFYYEPFVDDIGGLGDIKTRIWDAIIDKCH